MPRRDADERDDGYDDRPRRRGPKLHAGQPAWVLVLVVVGCVGFGGLFIVGMVLPLLAPPKPGAVANPVEVSAETLYQDYEADAPSAAAKYGNKTLRVRLKVDESRQIGDTLKIYQSGPGKVRVGAGIPVRDAGRIKTGETVVIRGVSDGLWLGSVDLTSCTLE